MNNPVGSEPLPLAATVVLMREMAVGPPEVLMLERASSMAFAAGALVFPGGRVEPNDYQLAGQFGDRSSGELDLAAARIAAIRETIEESGVAIGLRPAVDVATLHEIRSGLAANRPFSALLDELGLRLDLGALVSFARWLPHATAARRYDTFFFLAVAPEEAVELADGGETVRALWASARALLDDAEAGHHHIIFPTWCNLERLAQFATFEDARADAALHSHYITTGRAESRDGIEWMYIEEGIGYPVTRKPAHAKMRG